jgi:hypothetical protein
MTDTKYVVAYSYSLKKYVISSHVDDIYSQINLRANSKVLTRNDEFVDYTQIMRSSKYDTEIVVFDNEQEAEVSLLKFKRKQKIEKIL